MNTYRVYYGDDGGNFWFWKAVVGAAGCADAVARALQHVESNELKRAGQRLIVIGPSGTPQLFVVKPAPVRWIAEPA